MGGRKGAAPLRCHSRRFMCIYSIHFGAFASFVCLPVGGGGGKMAKWPTKAMATMAKR